MRLVVAGGVVLVAGLWLASLSGTASGPWLLGAALVLAGCGGLAAGIGREVEW